MRKRKREKGEKKSVSIVDIPLYVYMTETSADDMCQVYKDIFSKLPISVDLTRSVTTLKKKFKKKESIFIVVDLKRGGKRYLSCIKKKITEKKTKRKF